MSIAADAVWLQTKRILLGRKKLTKLCTGGLWVCDQNNSPVLCKEVWSFTL